MDSEVTQIIQLPDDGHKARAMSEDFLASIDIVMQNLRLKNSGNHFPAVDKPCRISTAGQNSKLPRTQFSMPCKTGSQIYFKYKFP